MNKIKLHLILSLLLMSLNGLAVTYTTNSQGYWHESSSWVNGDIPPYICSDTIIIQHSITFTDHLTLENGAYMEIESQGGLCGHQNLYLVNSQLIKYGILQIDTMDINSSIVNCYPPGEVIATGQIMMYGAGHSFSLSCPLAVGPWFECGSTFHPVEVVELSDSHMKIFPNPAKNEINVETTGIENAQISIYNLNNELLHSSKSNYTHKTTIDISNLPSGMYLLTISNSILFKTLWFTKK